MRSFVETGHCKAGTHCATCRDLEAGRSWRESLTLRFAVPGGAVDFVCPQGRPWGYVGPARGLGDKVAKIIHGLTGIRPCGGCHKRRELLNRLWPSKA